MPAAIDVKHLRKTFTAQTSEHSKILALDDVSLQINHGEIVVILGPNGAGKTTFLNILSTLILPDQGSIEILGIKSITKNFYQLRRLLNMSSGYPNFPWSLTVEENLRFYGRLYGLKSQALTHRIDQLIELFELEYFVKRRFDELSSGTKQKLSLAKAFINDPKIIFLDEPTVGLDPDVAIKTREIILQILKTTQVTVLLTTHNMQEAELMCQRIAFIKQGRLLRMATPQELKRMEGKKDLEEVFVELARRKTAEKETSVATEEFYSKENKWRTSSKLSWNLGVEINQWLNRCLAFTYRNFLFAVRNFFAFAELIFWPMVTLISIGLLGDYLELREKALAFVLTGAITAGILQVTQLDVAYSLLYEVWSKSVKQTMLAPVGISENLFGSWVMGMVRGSAIFLVLSVAAVVLFGFKFPGLMMTAVFLFGIFCCALLLGLIVSVLILIFGQKADITAWMFSYLFMLLCGIYYPVETLPSFLRGLAFSVPITYFLAYFRQGFGFSNDNSGSILLLKGFVLVIIYLAVGLALMRYAFDQARRKGIIVKLSE